MGKDKVDVSKLEKNQEKKKNDSDKEKSKKKEDISKIQPEKQLNYGIDTSNLTNAEYEALFLQRLESQEKQSKSPTAPKVEFSALNESDTSKQGQIEKLDGKSIKKMNSDLEKKKNQDIKELNAINYVRHCPKCNNFMKTTDSGSINCPKCNTQMVFAINCKKCSLWFDVKSAKKYPCPKCSDLISHEN
jgi:hypothetical protein